ncbi:MAG: hypothetical protein ACOCUH_03680 [Bacteriovoracia bacterium]
MEIIIPTANSSLMLNFLTQVFDAEWDETKEYLCTMEGVDFLLQEFPQEAMIGLAKLQNFNPQAFKIQVDDKEDLQAYSQTASFFYYRNNEGKHSESSVIKEDGNALWTEIFDPDGRAWVLYTNKK